jgi:hypothetical protein
VYWTNQAQNTIGTALLNGTGVNENFITGASLPTILAISGQKLYRGNSKTGSIGGWRTWTARA